MDKADIGKVPEAMKLYRDPALPYNADYNKDMKMEFNDKFTFSFEREIGWNMAFETTFVYRSIHMSNMEDVNEVFENGQFVDRVFPDEDTIMMRTWYDTPPLEIFLQRIDVQPEEKLHRPLWIPDQLLLDVAHLQESGMGSGRPGPVRLPQPELTGYGKLRPALVVPFFGLLPSSL